MRPSWQRKAEAECAGPSSRQPGGGHGQRQGLGLTGGVCELSPERPLGRKRSDQIHEVEMSAELDRWLERVGLAQYAQLFRDRDVTLDAIMSFTDRELQQLGLTPSASLTILREREQVATPVAAADTHHQAAERRQLTLMFCDLVDSVRLSSRLDPEDLRDIIGAYQSACAKSIQRYEGYVARYVGDGILAFFGYPVAHEDDAERSIRAAR